MRIKFSIIIPVYNSEKYISDSLKSALSQSFPKKNFEIIIINDSSIDKSKIIIQKFKKKYKNIKIINNRNNKKVSYCRNIGIKEAKGEYIIFLDSDDELKKNSLKKIDHIVNKSKPEVILCLEFKTNKFRILKKKIEKLDSVNSFLSYENKTRIYNPNCWNMVIEKKFLKNNKIYFKKIDIFEDQVFCTSVLFKVKKIKILPGTFYRYIQRPLSLSRNTNYLALYSCFLAIINFLKILKINKLKKNKIRFIKNRIEFIRYIFRLYVLICSLKQITKITQLYKSYKKRNSINKNFLDKYFFSVSRILNLRKRIIPRVLNNDYKNYGKIFIFGFGIEGRTIFHILKNNNIEIDSFVDSNKHFQNYDYFGKKIISPKTFKYRLNKNSNALILLNRTLSQSTDIKNFLQTLNIKRKVIDL